MTSVGICDKEEKLFWREAKRQEEWKNENRTDEDMSLPSSLTDIRENDTSRASLWVSLWKCCYLSTNLIQTIMFPLNWFSNVSPFSAVSCSDSYLEDSMVTLVVIPGKGSQSGQCYSSIINAQLFSTVCLQRFLLLFIHWEKKEDTPLFHTFAFWHDNFVHHQQGWLMQSWMCVVWVFEFPLKMATLSGLTHPEIHCLSNGFAW
jgi:hypothetical protein